MIVCYLMETAFWFVSFVYVLNYSLLLLCFRELQAKVDKMEKEMQDMGKRMHKQKFFSGYTRI
jgi:hypothetical protein